MTLLLGQFLLSPPQSGLENMAIDAALLERKIPTFRIYRWAHPTLSLGYFQAYPPDPPPLDLPPNLFHEIIRRPSAGGALYHYDEITFSLILPFSPQTPKILEKSYQFLLQLLILSFKKVGYSLKIRGGTPLHDHSFFCYDRHDPFDLLWNNHKLIGCAQRRNTTHFLHHGSIPLAPNPYNASWNYLEDATLEKKWIPVMKELLEEHLNLRLESRTWEKSDHDLTEKWRKKLGAESFLKRY